MKLIDMFDASAQQSAFVVPARERAAGAQAGIRRVDAHAPVLVPATGTAAGRRPWSPPTT